MELWNCGTVALSLNGFLYKKLCRQDKNKPFACVEVQTKGFRGLRVLARLGKDARNLAMPS